MKGAIMQPYFFPYIGYYQLAFEVEIFVFLDNVNYIKNGFINRNSILLNGNRHRFTIPVSKISQNRSINNHYYTGEFSDFLKLIKLNYKKAPYYHEAMPLIEAVTLKQDNNVARKNAETIISVFNYLGIERNFLFSSEVKIDVKERGQGLILSLCRELGILKYRNAIGGKTLYNPSDFNQAGVELKFLKSNSMPYSQGIPTFVSNLSIIDVLMHCSKNDILRMLGEYELV